MSETHFYEPRHGHGLPHDPFKAVVAPRPIGWISTVDAEGRPNLAPYSFFNAFWEVPPIVGFSSGGRKDSQRNAEATGEFVVNLATRRHAETLNLTSAPSRRASASSRRPAWPRPRRAWSARRAWPTPRPRWSAGSS
jgi:flavin reductase (DIM6/NTAB) family NADH-FMN oxidoreductase RutF